MVIALKIKEKEKKEREREREREREESKKENDATDRTGMIRGKKKTGCYRQKRKKKKEKERKTRRPKRGEAQIVVKRMDLLQIRLRGSQKNSLPLSFFF